MRTRRLTGRHTLSLIGVCVFGIILCLVHTRRNAHNNKTKIRNGKEGLTRILLWDKKLPYVASAAKQCQTKCEFTRERSQLGESQVVIFDGRYISATPPKRGNNQLWVFFSQEAPTRYVQEHHRNILFDKYDFNITSTYSLRSDVPVPQRKYYWKQNYNDSLDKTIYYTEGKHKMVAWFVSHCKTQSRREEFVRELSKHIPVDIYGKCGPLDCPRNKEQRCWTMLNTTYKFYLAFENSLCQEYVTEKVWDIFQRNINVVPVVMGGANYSNTLPNKTYINVVDFCGGNMSTVAKILADQLKSVAENKSKYNKYIAEKKRYFYKYRLPEYFCNLCKFVTERTPEDGFPPQDINQFWMGQEGVNRHCLTVDQYLKGNMKRPDLPSSL